MIRNAYRNHRKLGTLGACPAGMIANGSNCVLPQQLIETAQAGATYAAQPGDVLTAAQIASYPTADELAAAGYTGPALNYGAPATTGGGAPAGPIAVSTVPAGSTVNNCGDFPCSTADIETVQQVMYQYGDTWDNAQSIVSELYAAGIAPGAVTSSMALNSLTGIAASTTAAPAATTAVLTDPSTWPWYYWAGLAAAGFFLFNGEGTRKH
jgi:hypothetical protein